MRVIKTKDFAEWAEDEGLSDKALWDAIVEMEQGLVDANLGGNVYKKRIALPGRGKSGSVRTIVATKYQGIAYYMYGFPKNARANIKRDELKVLKILAKQLLGYSSRGIEKAIDAGEFIEVESYEKDDT